MSTLYAVKGGESWFEFDPNHQNGYVNINTNDGTSTWNTSTRTNCTYLRWKTGTSNPWIGVAAEMNAAINSAPTGKTGNADFSILRNSTVSKNADFTYYTISGKKLGKSGSEHPTKYTGISVRAGNGIISPFHQTN